MRCEEGAPRHDIPILVTGGTGTLGREVVPRLRNTGRDVRVLSRHGRADEDGIRYLTGDLATGEGVEPAVDGVETIIHCAGTARGDQVKARHLVVAASRAGTPHLVFISVVGADRIPVVSGIDRAMFGYFASKRAAEQVIAGSGLPWTTLRATQFHDLALLTVRQLARLPVAPDQAVGRHTWEEFLAERLSPSTRSSGGRAGQSLESPSR
jgi:uncharacterized protein YbjT (DUF2867 family)